jgi:hypothetical protein
MTSYAFVPSGKRKGRVCDNEPPRCNVRVGQPDRRQVMHLAKMPVKQTFAQVGRELSYVSHGLCGTTCKRSNHNVVWPSAIDERGLLEPHRHCVAVRCLTMRSGAGGAGVGNKLGSLFFRALERRFRVRRSRVRGLCPSPSAAAQMQRPWHQRVTSTIWRQPQSFSRAAVRDRHRRFANRVGKRT